MAGWVLVPCLGQLRAELNRVAPNRDRASDGTIGDVAHQLSVSDHNDDEIGRVPIRDADSKHEVHAYDADHDLRTPGLTMEDVVQHILRRCRSGAEVRLRYIIYNRRIWEASNEWRERKYTGASPHTEHAHFSSSYDTAREANTSPWLVGLIDNAGGGNDVLVREGEGPSEDVKFWQYILQELGYGTQLGEVDGEYGPKMSAAVNADRKARGTGPSDMITGWHGFVMLKSMMAKHAGQDGKPGQPGQPGQPGPAFSGTLRITGGTLEATAQ